MNKILFLLGLTLFGMVLAGACGPVEDITGTGDDPAPVTTTTPGTVLIWDQGLWDNNVWQ